MDDVKQKRFVWGVLLAWVPAISMVIGLANVFRGISQEKATGLAAVAGGLAETLVTWGVGWMIVAQVAAIVLLVRAFERGHRTRSLFAILSIGLSGLMLVLVGAFLWLSWYLQHHTF